MVATRPASVNGLACSAGQARAELESLWEIFTLLRDERAIFQHWEALVAQYEVMGKSAHDARLVAAMMRHGVSHILTFNGADFARFSNITVISPNEV